MITSVAFRNYRLPGRDSALLSACCPLPLPREIQRYLSHWVSCLLLFRPRPSTSRKASGFAAPFLT